MFGIVISCALFVGATQGSGNVEPAEAIYFGGDIVTVDDKCPTAEALAVNKGRILAVGAKHDVLRHKTDATRMIDLAGKTLLPGFIDPHSHLMNALMVLDWANVSSPPVGTVTDIAGLIAEIKRAELRQKPAKGDWIIAYGYDADLLREHRPLTRGDLDPYFPDNPVMVIHVSNHGAVLNSAGFERVGISANTPTPEGGVILREEGTNEPAGFIMETAFLPVFMKMPKPSREKLLEALKPAQDQYAANGYTTVQEGATSKEDLDFLRLGAGQERLFLDVVSLPVFADAPKIVGQPGYTFGTYDHRLKLGAVKIITDGSPQYKTAYWSQPLLTVGPVGQKHWRGSRDMTPGEIDAIFELCYRNEVRVFSHANGDAAIDMVIAAHRKHNGNRTDRLPIVVHSQFMRPEQLDAYAELGMMPSFFTNHTFYWGDIHVQNLGYQRASFMSPAASALKRGLMFSNHTDYTVTPLDPMFTVWTAVNRISRSGEAIGPTERVSPLEAIKALTVYAAHQYLEHDAKGSLTPGKLADMVIVSANPLAADPMRIKEIRVVETIKEGRTVYAAP
ncbi:MAG TPA: amidohydrolase [Pirellulales bacterium]|nr:amidohydrolase [Pirellulales bacterium]